MDHAEAFLLDQVPLTKRSLIPSTLKNSYAAASLLIEGEPILQVPSAQDNRGRIIQWAVDMAFERLCKSGQWSYECRWRPFAKPTGRFLEIMPSHSVVTISQVADPSKQPRDVVFRANRRLSNQGWLTGLPNPKVDYDTVGLPHVLLIHGHQNLNFAHLGIPNEHHSQGYRYRTKNLLMMPHEVRSPEPPPEDTDIEAVMTLKEEIDKWRKDNGK
ncbi:MAG: hypothetical protein H7Y60_02515 [Rhodospirillaceae bacterium]|nr:hypothetical protein [Rhodospirillales bacterium]